MSSYEPIDCNDYDFLEIACMDAYDIDVILDEGNFRGTARGLETRSGEELLRVATSGEDIQEIRIDRIREIHVLTKNARFRKHSFGDHKKRAPEN